MNRDGKRLLADFDDFGGRSRGGQVRGKAWHLPKHL